MRLMNQIAFWLDRLNANLGPIITTIGVLFAVAISLSLLNRFLKPHFERFETLLRLPRKISFRFMRLVAVAVWLMAAIFILEVWGVNVSGLWTFLMSVVAVIGVGFLATWTIVSNVTASFFLMIWRPFQFGDTVELIPDNLKGRVVDRNFMYVFLREDSGALIKVPNNMFFQKIIRVSTKDHPQDASEMD
jgi:small-conductance mechanosensitive channel